MNKTEIVEKYEHLYEEMKKITCVLERKMFFSVELRLRLKNLRVQTVLLRSFDHRGGMLEQTFDKFLVTIKQVIVEISKTKAVIKNKEEIISRLKETKDEVESCVTLMCLSK